LVTYPFHSYYPFSYFSFIYIFFRSLLCLFFCPSMSSPLFLYFLPIFFHFLLRSFLYSLGRSWNTVLHNRVKVFYFSETVIHLTGQFGHGVGPIQGLYLHKTQKILWGIEIGQEFLSSINNKEISVHYFQETTSVPILHGLFRIQIGG
jgi:hypothetical protein